VRAAQDVEKLAPKKGVIVQSVKEVLQALVDDSLLHQDKIGAWQLQACVVVNAAARGLTRACCVQASQTSSGASPARLP
jgi:hypothetical protein